MNNSPSNIFYMLLLFEMYHQNCLAVWSINGFRSLVHINSCHQRLCTNTHRRAPITLNLAAINHLAATMVK